ncbi:homeobox protein GHOX-7-like [Paroedura picta]|uniref:homeobox protein GHOX-7-like n=1 Tax=Paroedura picta TaxID=143630 RepID=UPI004057B890
MANVSLSSFSSLRVLPIWPFSGREGLPTFPSSDDPQQRGPSALPRTRPSRRVVDFSIRSLLALESSEGGKAPQDDPPAVTTEWGGAPQGYAWIRCTRFKPPALPKVKRSGGSRPPSRSPRVPFSATQLGALETSFQQTRYLSMGQVRNVALLLGLTENRVKIWFQNRRARERRDFLKQQPNRPVDAKGGPLQDQSPSGWCGVQRQG